MRGIRLHIWFGSIDLSHPSRLYLILMFVHYSISIIIIHTYSGIVSNASVLNSILFYNIGMLHLRWKFGNVINIRD